MQLAIILTIGYLVLGLTGIYAAYRSYDDDVDVDSSSGLQSKPATRAHSPVHYVHPDWDHKKKVGRRVKKSAPPLKQDEDESITLPVEGDVAGDSGDEDVEPKVTQEEEEEDDDDEEDLAQESMSYGMQAKKLSKQEATEKLKQYTLANKAVTEEIQTVNKAIQSARALGQSLYSLKKRLKKLKKKKSTIAVNVAQLKKNTKK